MFSKSLLQALLILSIAPAHKCFSQLGRIDTNSIRSAIDSCGNIENALEKLNCQENTFAYINQALHLTQTEKERIFLNNSEIFLLRKIGNQYKDDFKNYPKALEAYRECLKRARDANNLLETGKASFNMGNIYSELDEQKKSLECYQNALENFKAIGFKIGIGKSLNGIGNSYNNLKQFDRAFENYQKSLKEQTDSVEISTTLVNIAAMFKSGKNYQNAINYYWQALALSEKINDPQGIVFALIGIGEINTEQDQIKEAEKHFGRALYLAKQERMMDREIVLRRSLRKIYEKQGRFREALSMSDTAIALNDSLTSSHKKDEILRMDMKADYEKKEATEKARHEKELAVTEEEKRKQKVIIWSVAGGLLLVLVFSILLFNRFRITNKQKAIIEEKNKLVEEKNKSITDSINYAKRIQQAMLPDKRQIHSVLPENFILFKPKDIVSGDFYFFHQKNDAAFIAAVDCTGHGVPGAFMSMIGSEKLGEAVVSSSHVSEILSNLNKGIKTSLKQSGSDDSTRDGMDIALCSVQKDSKTVQYAGANRPIWIIRKESAKVEEIKATKKAIGGFTEDGQRFETHTLPLQSGDSFYIFSDGYADTFGGGQDKKLTTKKFKEILLSIQNKPMKEQERHLDDFIENWKAGAEQIDDILVIGVRL